MSIVDQVTEAAKQPLEDAHSLPFPAYTDPEVYAAEAVKVFAADWVFVCMAGELANPGDYFALSLAGEPIIVLRDDVGELRALSNICRHRGTVMLDAGFGRVDKFITCPYHAWAYSKQGELQAVPHNKLIAVDRAEHRLDQFALETWNGLVFVHLGANPTALRDRLSGIDDYLRLFNPGSFDQVSAGEIESWQTNWKLAMENAMESYHLFKVHAQTLELYSPTRDAYYIAGNSEWTLTGGATQRKKGLLDKLLGEAHSELYDHYILVSLPPSFVGILSYGSFGWLSAHPLDAHTTQIRSGASYLGGGAGEVQVDEFTKAFFLEDKEMCERVQLGMQARLGRGGKLVDLERVVTDFHQYLASRLGGLPSTQRYEDVAAEQWKRAAE